MPFYDYSCGACAHAFTVRQGFHDDPSVACPKCGGAGKRQLSIPAVVYKGSGFYSTDYPGRSGTVSSRSDSAEHDGPADSAASDPTASSSSDTASDHSHPHDF